MKGKYQYNPEKLSYSKVDYNLWQKFLRYVLPQILAAFVIAFLLFLAVSYVVDTTEERKLKNQNKFLEENYGRLEDKYSNAQKVLTDLQSRDKNIYKAIFEAEPGAMFENQLQINLDKYVEYSPLEKSRLLGNNEKRLDTIEYKIAVKEDFYQELYKLIETKSEMLKNVPAILPLKEKVENITAYGFGQRLDPFYKSNVFHTGIDFAIPVGTVVVATGDGVVTRTLTTRRQYGMHLVISHGFGYESLYANLDQIRVHPGQKVKRGDIIAFSGNTGKSAAPHLHYEVRKNGKAVNPVNFIFLNLSPEQFDQLSFKASQAGQVLD
jgi:murein DD-endopeptidase MepM/ murein hydrolase activator NlpD